MVWYNVGLMGIEIITKQSSATFAFQSQSNTRLR